MMRITCIEVYVGKSDLPSVTSMASTGENATTTEFCVEPLTTLTFNNHQICGKLFVTRRVFKIGGYGLYESLCLITMKGGHDLMNADETQIHKLCPF